MKKNILSVTATLLLLFFVSCEKENNPDLTTVDLNNTTWGITSNPLVGSSINFDILFKDNDSIYINSLPIGIGTWSTTSDSVQFGIDTLGTKLTYIGGFPSDTTMQGRMIFGVVPVGTFTGIQK